VLTATSGTSRNFSLGRAIGSGRGIDELTGKGQPLAEGAETAPALVTRARAIGVELPIAETTASVLAGELSPSAAIAKLMSRRLTSE
jgi:glycerol-3-phosphate dehydrogenase (NAD(P)+)